MRKVVISTQQDLPSSNIAQSSLRLREITLIARIETLREIAICLLRELESLGSMITASTPEKGFNLEDEVRRFEVDLIRAALIKARGNQALAARLLGVKHTTLNSKIKRYRIRHASHGVSSPPSGAEFENR